jgi:mRNA interferase YafQ
MREIEFTHLFRRDYKRVLKGPHGAALDSYLQAVIDLLAEDRPLPIRHVDHALRGEWKDHRDCHIKPDLVLIYRRPDDRRLQLVRLGSHSELGL